MKNSFKIIGGALLVLGFNLPVVAADATMVTTPNTTTTTTTTAIPPMEGPCKNIVDACSSAGFVMGGSSQGKGLWMNCVKPILSGETIVGVKVDASDVTACQVKKDDLEKSLMVK